MTPVLCLRSASERAKQNKRSTVNHEDVWGALQDLENDFLDQIVSPAYEGMVLVWHV